MAGRPSLLDDPEMRETIAAAFADGWTREQMCAGFGIKDPKTITRWRHDPRIKTIARRIINDRVQAIASKTDSEIARRLQEPEKLTVKEMLDIRKEFLGGQLRDETEQIDEATINEAMSLLEDDPDAVDEMRELLSRARVKGARAVTPED
jgi:hypothetical protein